MNTFEIVLIIALVLGVIGSNLALLKYSSKFKIPPNVKQHFEQQDSAPKNGAEENPQQQDSKQQKDSEHALSEQSKDDEKSQK